MVVQYIGTEIFLTDVILNSRMDWTRPGQAVKEFSKLLKQFESCKAENVLRIWINIKWTNKNCLYHRSFLPRYNFANECGGKFPPTTHIIILVKSMEKYNSCKENKTKEQYARRRTGVGNFPGQPEFQTRGSSARTCRPGYLIYFSQPSFRRHRNVRKFVHYN